MEKQNKSLGQILKDILFYSLLILTLIYSSMAVIYGYKELQKQDDVVQRESKRYYNNVDDYNEGYNTAISQISDLNYGQNVFGNITSFTASYTSLNRVFDVVNLNQYNSGNYEYRLLKMPTGNLNMSELKSGVSDFSGVTDFTFTLTSNLAYFSKSGLVSFPSDNNSCITYISFLDNQNNNIGYITNQNIIKNGWNYEFVIPDDIVGSNARIQFNINYSLLPSNFAFNFDGINYDYQTGYDYGYSQALIDIKNNPNDYDLYDKSQYDGNYTSGYNQGYNQGVLEGEGLGERGFLVMFNAIMNAPFNILNGLLNFELFGINLFSLVSFILTIGIIVFVGALLIKK